MDPLMRRVAFLVSVTLLSIGCKPALADDERQRYLAVRDYWEWSNYWEPNGVDFPKAAFDAQSSFKAIVFFSSSLSEELPSWGFCSKAVGVCQAYWAAKDASILRASGIVMQGTETDEEAFARFRNQQFEEVVPLPSTGGLLLQPPTADRKPERVTRSDEASNSLRHLNKTVTLDKLNIPEATRLKRRNRFVEDQVKKAGPSPCQVIVPFADERSPVIPVLSACPEEKSIMLMRRIGDEWVATVGGWLRLGAEDEPIEGRIRAHASLKTDPR